MAFTTGGQKLPRKAFRIRMREAQTSSLKDRIDDLETALLCNTCLLQDITSSKQSSSHRTADVSQETEPFLLFPLSCYQKLQNQQTTMVELIQRLRSDALEAKEREWSYERQTEDFKVLDARNIRDLAAKVKELKIAVQEKERFIQDLEQKHSTLEAEMSFGKKDKEHGVNPRITGQKMKKLIKEVDRKSVV